MTSKIFQHDQKLTRRGRISLGHEVKLMLENAHLDIWSTPGEDINEKHVVKCVQNAEMENFHDKLKLDIDSMSRLRLYKTLKHEFSLEKYVTVLTYRKQRSAFAKMRMGVLPVHEETGRYRGIPSEQKL